MLRPYHVLPSSRSYILVEQARTVINQDAVNWRQQLGQTFLISTNNDYEDDDCRRDKFIINRWRGDDDDEDKENLTQ